jgi:hypothetical protein
MKGGRSYRNSAPKAVPLKGVIPMKHDLLSGLLYGVVLGLFFAPQLAGHLPLIVILAVLFGAKMLSIK